MKDYDQMKEIVDIFSDFLGIWHIGIWKRSNLNVFTRPLKNVISYIS